jgi:hypothetical protein
MGADRGRKGHFSEGGKRKRKKKILEGGKG